VVLSFSVTDAAAAGLRQRINDAGQGGVGWPDEMTG
jgi:hypothetical protein